MSIDRGGASSTPGIFPNPDTLTQRTSTDSGKILSDGKFSEGSHIYTNLDLRILKAKIIVHLYNPGSEVGLFNEFTYMNIIDDFERRFNCRFDDIRKTSKAAMIQIEMGKTREEHWLFVNKYISLSYSR